MYYKSLDVFWLVMLVLFIGMTCFQVYAQNWLWAALDAFFIWISWNNIRYTKRKSEEENA